MTVYINDKQYTAYELKCANVVIADVDSDNVNVRMKESYKVKSISPKQLDINVATNFNVACPSKLCVEFENKKPLFLFLYKPEQVNPDDYDYYFKSGEHSLEQLTLMAGQSVYLETGAVLKTHVYAEYADDIKICGHGIIDTVGIGEKGRRMLYFKSCNNLQIEDVSLFGAISWCVVPIACNNVNISGLNIITYEVNGDGIDLVGCENVQVDNCFIHAADDCVAIKANDYDDNIGCKDCFNITVKGCILWNTRPGNAIEIGFETRCDEIYNVTFEDIDVLHCEFEGWQSGGVLTIHNGDRAKIHDILYKNIRVEDASQKLIDFKIFNSRYSKDLQRGQIYNIIVEDVTYLGDKMPPSILRGFDFNHLINNIKVINLTHKGVKKASAIDAHMITEMSTDVVFE